MRVLFFKRVRVSIILAITMLYAVNGYAQNLKTNQRINPNTDTAQLTQAESQQSAIDANLKASENTSPFDAVKGLKEDQSKRDAFSKHYINEDGSFTALIGAGPIHYEKNGQFLDIDHNITSNFDSNFPYANTTNLFESYFGATSHTGVKNKTAEGEIQEFLNTKMYWEINGQAVNTQNSANRSIRIEGDKAYYDNIFGNISAEFTTLTGKRKLNYIIPNQQALGNIPSGVDFLVFTEDVILPFGWTSSITESGVMIKDQLGKEIYLYENPISTDALQNELEAQGNTIFETYQLGNTLTVKTKVKVAWLLSNERVFPVMVDPTTEVRPNNDTNWTRSVRSSGANLTNLYFGAADTYWLRGFIKFNVSSITSQSTNLVVNSATGYINIIGAWGNYNRPWQFANSADPTAGGGTALYNSANLGLSQIGSFNSGGWKSSAFYVPGGVESLANSLNNGHLNLSVTHAGTYYNNEYYQVAGHNSSDRPYIVINWEPISTDRTLIVSEAYTGASHANGNHTIANNTSVTATSGTRTGYIVTGWEGTGSVPATGTGGSTTFTITQNSTINWLWEQTGTPKNIIFHNYGGSEQLAFNNSRIDTNTPIFRMSHGAYDASDYEVEINTAPNFTGTSYSQTFTGTYPLNTEANFTFTNGFVPSNNTTYYVRARVRGEADVWSTWTTETYSFTYQTPNAIPDWFQTTQAQFLTDALSGVNANASGDVVTIAGGNAIVNGDFETNTTGWTKSSNYSAGYSAVRSTAWASTGTASLQMYHNNPGSTGYFSGDHVSMYQTVDLTGVSTLQMDANYSGAGSVIVQLRVYVAETTQATGTTGTLVHTWVPPSNASNSTININLSSYGFTGNKVVKIVYYVTGQETTYNMRYLSVDNIRTTSLPQGSITSTPIHLASVQGATAYEGITWNQTLDGGNLTLKVQQSANGTSGWADVAGYNTISMAGDGEKTFDLSEMTAYPHIRLVGALDGQNVKLHDWAVSFKQEDCATSTTWNGTAWSDGEPTESTLKKVIFTGDYTPVATDFPSLFACAVDVQGTAQVILPNGFNFIVENEVKVAPEAKLTVKDGANLVQINDDAVNEGEITVEKLFTFSEGREQYNLIGSPVLGQNLKVIYNGNPKTQIYNELNNWFDTSDGVYTLGVGQSINEAKVTDEPNSLTTAIFEGVPFNGKHTLSGLTAQKTGFHLIANPYPSQLDLDQLYTDNLDLEPRFLFWDNRGNEQLTQYGDGYQGDHYAQYNALSGGTAAEGETVVDATKIPNGLAAVGSAFMVRLKTPGMTGSLGFKNSQRKIGERVNFLGKENETHEKDRYWLTLNTPTDWSVMQLVAYFEGGDDGYGLDDNKAPNSSTGFYSILNNHHLAIQGKSSFAVSDTIALGYRAFEVGKHRINLFKQEGVFVNGQSIYLIDHELDTVHNLSESLYEFETEVGEFNERFLIVYQEDEVLSSLDLASVGLQVFRQNKKTVIRSLNQDLKALKVFNLNGQLLLDNDNLSGKYYHLPEGRFGKQVLLLNITTADGRIHSVKVLTH